MRYNKLFSEKEIESLLLVQKILTYNTFNAIKDNEKHKKYKLNIEEKMVELKHSISMDVLAAEELYTLMSSHTSMPLICTDTSGKNTHFFLCSEMKKAEDLEEYRKSAHGEDCFIEKITLDDLFEYLFVHGYDAVRYISDLNWSILLESNDLFDALDDVSVCMNKSCFRGIKPNYELAITTLQYFQKKGDCKNSYPMSDEDIIDLRSRMQYLLMTSPLYAPITGEYNDPNSEILPRWNVCAEAAVIDGNIKSVYAFYTDHETLQKNYAAEMKCVQTTAGVLLLELHASQFKLRIGKFSAILSSRDVHAFAPITVHG